MAREELIEERGLPGSEERRQILEHAREVALQGRAILERLEQLDDGFWGGSRPTQCLKIPERADVPGAAPSPGVRQF